MFPIAVVLWILLGLPPLAAAPDTVEFNRDVRPILSDRCFACHGPDSGNRKSRLRLDTEEGIRLGVVPGDPARSSVFQRITASNAGLRMPPMWAGHDKLSDTEISTIERWIRQGARWQGHWSFLPPRKPEALPVAGDGWARNAIDTLVLRRLEREGLKPAPEADPATLIRRVTLDLTGLPPSPAEVESYLSDSSPGAYERAVDRLLASPRYAERMAIRWLEAARYADTNGYQTDGPRDMWRWRDWVIQAFHTNMPFDRFTIEQIAGDLLPAATLDQKIAAAFHRNHRTSAEGGIVEEEFRVEYVADRVETTATVWLGLTLGCARCHDHKYDPFPQKDFYRLFAFFNNVPERGLVYNFGNEEPFIKAPTPEMQSQLDAWDARVREADRQWRLVQPELARAQRKWEKSLRGKPPLDWTIEKGLVLQAALDRSQRFDGTRVDDRGDQARFDYQDPFTLAAWIEPDAADGAIVSRMEDYWEGEGYGLFLKNGKLRLMITRRFTDISLRVETRQAVRLNEWQHVAVTYDGHRKAKGVRLAINGVPQDVHVEFDELTYPFGPKEPFRIGAGGGLRFRGRIADVRVYNRALTIEELAVLPLGESVSALARVPEARRSVAQSHKLRLCFLERFAPEPIRRARETLAAATQGRRQYFESIPTVMTMVESPQPRATFVLKRGAYDAPGETVTPGTPSALPPMPAGAPANRLGLARWLVDRGNPLTARVIVNRFWQMLFGVGLVKTVEDFGSQGEWPVHAELLDWLAVEFMDSGWNVKQILKTIVTSATYRQSSRVTPESFQRDPENRLLARGPRFRLPAEVIRDQALAVSGLLVEQSGGPSVRPYQPPGLWQELHGGKGYVPDRNEGLYRRSIYTYWKRTVPPPAMITFDAPMRETCAVRETRTNTPLQALNLMNDTIYLEASRHLAARMLRSAGTPGERIAWGYRTVLARDPKPAESQVLAQTLDRFRQRYARDPQAANRFLRQGDSPVDQRLDPAEHAAYMVIASILLNLDETITKE